MKEENCRVLDGRSGDSDAQTSVQTTTNQNGDPEYIIRITLPVFEQQQKISTVQISDEKKRYNNQ